MKTIVTIGGYLKEGGEGAGSWLDMWFDTPIEIDREIVKLTGKKAPRVLFIPTASSDSRGYEAAFRKNYEGKLNCEVDVLKLVREKSSPKGIQTKIDWADIIYVGGGNTLKMMKKWRRLGVDKMLKRAWEQGKVLCGVSAGSICWFEYGISDSLHFYNSKETKYIRVRGLGFLKGIHNPHFGSEREDCKYRTKGMKEIMQRSKGKCLGVPDACAVIFEGNHYRVIGKPEASQVWYEKGKYCERQIPREGVS
jgi:dipeptidase E